MTTAHLLFELLLLVIIAILLWGILQTTSTIASLLQDELKVLRNLLQRLRIWGPS